MTLIKLSNVSKILGGRLIIRSVSLTVNEAETLVIMGPSGCGKTTLLRLIASDLKPDEGNIHFLAITPDEIGFILQRLYVFPWLTVRDNVGFGLRTGSRNRGDRIASMLELLGLANVASLYPAELSGGMLQRVAIGRTLILNPKLILMDEPFTGLDYVRRRSLYTLIQRLRSETGISVVLVTHNAQDAFLLGTRIILFSSSGTLAATYNKLDDLDEVARHELATALGIDWISSKTPNRVLI